METISAQQYPPKIQQLRHSIVHAEALVDDLTSRLVAAQKEYEGLQNKWLQYRASIAPIRKCPSELLLMMFELDLVDNPRSVRRLLLVCKHWYQVVSSSPQLWKRISVEFTDDWDVEFISKSTNRYVDMCLQRSGSMMLELRLDFPQLLSIRGQIIGCILGGLQDFVSSEGQDTLFDWTARLDTDELEWIMSSGHIDHAFELIDKLLGESGSRMRRWGSLELQLPEHDNGLAKEIWDQFIYPAPKLSRMVVGTSQYHLPQHLNADIHPFPSLPALKHLEMQDVPDRRSFTATASCLESIIIHGGIEEWTTTFLSSFTRLKTLELAEGYDEMYSHSTQLSAQYIISLPELLQLTVRGSFSHLWNVDFIVPKLYSLDIIQNAYSLYTLTLPKVKPLNVRWEMEDWSYDDRPQDLDSTFREIVLEYHRSAEHLTCPHFPRERIIAILNELKAGGTLTLSSALRTVAFE